jgi:hypothetical protein
MTGGRKQEKQNQIVKKAKEIEVSVGGAKGHIFDGVDCRIGGVELELLGG